MEYGLIGKKLSHSLSVEVHKAIGRVIGYYDYKLVELSEDELDDFFAKKDFLGINVTIPYKVTVMKYLDWIEPRAKKIGCVNTIVNDDGILRGYNTDYQGLFLSLPRLHEFGVFGKIAILGTGGTSLTALYTAKKKFPFSKVVRVSRNPEGKDVIGYDRIPKDVKMIINCTPVGMYPNSDGQSLSLDGFNKLKFVYDAIYNPRRTRLILDAEKRKIPCRYGIFMLMIQGINSAEWFFNKYINFHDVFEQFVHFNNIVLVGMPSSGKTTIGKMVADKLGREFYDTDEIIEKRENMSIKEIFESKGEEYFRRIEADVVKEVSSIADGRVISTGGGVILNENNVLNLRSNGEVVFLNVPLSKLSPSENRPLSADSEALERLYNERHQKYLDAADYEIVFETPENACEQIIRYEKGE